MVNTSLTKKPYNYQDTNEQKGTHVAFFIPKRNFTIGVTKKEISDYAEARRNGTTDLSFIQYIKGQMGLPDHQEVVVEAEYTNEEYAKEKTPNYINLKEVNLSEGDFSSTDYSDNSRSNIVFRNVTFPKASFMKGIHIERESIRGEDYRKTQNLLGPILTVEEWRTEHKDLDDTIKAEQRNRHILRTYKPSSAEIQNTIAAHNSTIWSITETGKYFFKTMSPVYNTNDILSMDSVFDVYRFDSIENNDASKLKEVEKMATTHVEKVVDAALNKTRTRGWFGRDISTNKSKRINDGIKSTLIKEMKDSGFLGKEFLIRTDTAPLQDFLDKNLPLWQKTLDENITNQNPTASDVTKSLNSNNNVTEAIKTWEKSITEERDRWTTLNKYSSQDKSKWKTKKPSVEIKLPGGLSNISVWPSISPNDKQAREEDLRLKKEGLRVLVSGSTAALGGLGMTAAWLGAINATTGVAAVVTSIAAGVATDKIISTQMTLDNYESFNNKFGDLLLELGTGKRACERAAGFTGVTAINQYLLSKVLPNQFVAPAQTFNGALLGIGAWITGRNISACYSTIQSEKNKSPTNRNRPGSPEFNNKLDPKLIHMPKLAVSAALSVTLVLAFTLAAVFAGPAIAPFMATIGALSTTQLAIGGILATAGFTVAGYATYNKASSYFKNKSQKKQSRPNVSNERNTREESPERTPSQNRARTSERTQSQNRNRSPERSQSHVERLREQRNRSPQTRGRSDNP
ncbi:MAG: hypothetical protein K0T99_01025 [Alphaproteobacteria bacterium]|nr:hypothetical protein [Alphaproteobacteria bacterium]